MKVLYALTGALIIFSVFYLVGISGAEKEVPNNGYALLIAPVINGDNSPLQKAVEMRDYLISKGWLDNQIIFLSGGSSASYVDGPATPDRVIQELDNLIAGSNERTYAQIDVYDHVQDINGKLYFNLEGGQLDISTVVNKVNNVVDSWMLLELNTNLADNVAQNIQKTEKIVICSHALNQKTDVNYFDLAEGLTTPGADSNHDGAVSIEEAFNYEYTKVVNLSDGKQTPVMYDNA